jgi:ATP-dependent protease ClpP protease subunit
MGKIKKDYLDHWYDYSIDLDNRTLWLGSTAEEAAGSESGVEYSLVENVIKSLHLLEKNAPNGDKPVFILLNNPGGDEIEGMAIYDAIKACKNHVTITVYGKVMSMAGYILQAADYRIMAPNSVFMMHEGTRGLPSDHPRIVKNWNKYYDKVDEILFNLYLNKIKEKHPEFSKKKLDDMLKFDTILTALETVDLGLADKVLE